MILKEVENEDFNNYMLKAIKEDAVKIKEKKEIENLLDILDK